MKAGHYLNRAEKAYEILNKFHTKMFELGGEESEHWCDELNHWERVLRQAIEWGKDSEEFLILEKQDRKIHSCNYYLKDYQNQINYLKTLIKKTKQQKVDLLKEKDDLLVEFNLDHKNIEKRLSQSYPEFT
mgnify:CR=1 FL=1|tara:strand:- start:339 stop:731 length:393 start_codon:yes stop_codon:yes gene_type:complete